MRNEGATELAEKMEIVVEKMSNVVPTTMKKMNEMAPKKLLT